ncbi:hypothetical protein FRC02_008050 [Tulasnella sp. 418]|nr:hypothetical protein FRC02_008050 [Tulasnella sp. 418]
MELSRLFSLTLLFGHATVFALPLGENDMKQALMTTNGNQRTMMTDCPQINVILLPELQMNLNIAYLGEGNSGCVYDVTNNWKGKPAVAKTPKLAGGKISANELTALRKMDQLYANVIVQGRYWAIIEKIDGVKLRNTAAWAQYVGLGNHIAMDKDVKECMEFMERAYKAVEEAAAYYVRRFNILHQDLQPNNIFFNDDGDEAKFIDWGSYAENYTNEAEARKYGREKAFEWSPSTDYLGRPGICVKRVGN